ncbi:hypothetical protein MTQ10_27460 [Streptomyces sp. XM83C]|uniref:Low molecular weight antigen MTB12-like C-terminal domain-containing protein n=1 Tax=Streptomyces thermocoprophilus TaxID=78356 RepID=A0ABV5VHI8_9ACTN|nr:hypothetical protein [Streptomyces sp. XM83C]MCK1823228.1 hypothetical protein [Streptomyces sp. XM83C]
MVLGSTYRHRTRTERRGPRAAGRGTASAVALLLILAPVLAACDDGDGGGGSASATPTAQTATGGTATGTATGAPADAAAAEREIKENWQKFFDPATPLKDKQRLLENGEQMAPVLQAFSGDKRGGQVTARVEDTEFTSATEATVTYTLLLNGATALPDASGTAVEQDGTWKVSVRTLCALVQLSGNGSATQSPLPGC